MGLLGCDSIWRLAVSQAIRFDKASLDHVVTLVFKSLVLPLVAKSLNYSPDEAAGGYSTT